MDFDAYLERFGFGGPRLSDPPHPDTCLIVVIPCHNEPDLVGSLQALANCDPPDRPVEVIVVINAGAHQEQNIHHQNRKTLEAAKKWIEAVPKHLRVPLIEENQLPKKTAGVGLARKIGMDEAAGRLLSLSRPEGVILCFDADSRCDSNYLREVEGWFNAHPKKNACSIHFEHPLTGDDQPILVYEGIVHYELFLRFYRQALVQAGFPFAYHTIGSSMAVRAETYLKQGGMNKRKAGEDFYFLQKLMPLGGFGEITTTTVRPSPRVSDRVPFGTGKAIADWLYGGKQKGGYPIEIFRQLSQLLTAVDALAEGAGPEVFRQAGTEAQFAFLDTLNWQERLRDIRKNTTTPAAYRKRFFMWFNGFVVLKLIHYLRDNAEWESHALDVNCRKLLEWKGETGFETATEQELLHRFRQLDRAGIQAADAV